MLGHKIDFEDESTTTEDYALGTLGHCGDRSDCDSRVNVLPKLVGLLMNTAGCFSVVTPINDCDA
jgi:hypothetical protein